MRSFWLISFWLLLLPARGSAQEPFLKDFRAYQSGQQVELVWIIRGGNTCFGTTIERAADGEAFMTIGEISGICGSNEGDERYTFSDSTPGKNAFNHYRLKFGGVGTSNTQTVEFLVLKDAGFIIVGNPLLDEAFIQFPNPAQELHIAQIYDLSGKVRLTKTAKGRQIRIGRGELQSGLYVVELSMSATAHEPFYGILLVK